MFEKYEEKMDGIFSSAPTSKCGKLLIIYIDKVSNLLKINMQICTAVTIKVHIDWFNLELV